ncbi:MAG: 4-(cytidine 5'-diphospho)-2-C-methyl-D-erythritol kinase [Spirosoma sp.]|nr:4-(cytidine 5'-diphospho)-2-C-methyl-D-erythritol kinase [Spirosoma sp.]
MLSFPNAKINIGLRITAKRPDGFHTLQSGFYPVNWTDALEIIPTETFAFSSSGLTIPGSNPGQNLCVRAYNMLRADFHLPPVQIHLHKIIPIGAGLGGGSSDAAFALKMLNERFTLGLTMGQLENYARRLGSDCAFFVENRPVYCIAKGDVFEEIDLNLSGYHALLVYPNVAISTAEAYAGVRPQQPETSLRGQLTAPVATWRDTVRNDFEDSLFPKYPLLARIKAELYEAGAVYASMSGSGSTVYGLFNTPVLVPNQFRDYRVWKGRLQ